MAKKSLFDDVFEKTELAYLSDLHQERNYQMVIPAIRMLDAQAYSLSEWNSFVSYVTGQQVSSQSAEEARDYLLSYTESRKRALPKRPE